MVKWNEFVASEFEEDEDIENKLAAHFIRFDEAVQCFFNGFEVRSNKKFPDRFQLWGTTDAGRDLKIIFQLKPGNVVRIITGWEI
ncbi:MAG: hypothetical protein IV090_20340 [Candidatus Sericytochromatia bacterium]|nr:hypothetical protein [Candidatus Sericytochromatia bacterium]